MLYGGGELLTFIKVVKQFIFIWIFFSQSWKIILTNIIICLFAGRMLFRFRHRLRNSRFTVPSPASSSNHHFRRALYILHTYDAFYLYRLCHGCVRVAHCVTARWRNFSHYCRPLRQYDVWFTCSEHTEALTGAPTAYGVHKREFTVQGGK